MNENTDNTIAKKKTKRLAPFLWKSDETDAAAAVDSDNAVAVDAVDAVAYDVGEGCC